MSNCNCKTIYKRGLNAIRTFKAVSGNLFTDDEISTIYKRADYCCSLSRRNKEFCYEQCILELLDFIKMKDKYIMQLENYICNLHYDEFLPSVFDVDNSCDVDIADDYDPYIEE